MMSMYLDDLHTEFLPTIYLLLYANLCKQNSFEIESKSLVINSSIRIDPKSHFVSLIELF